MIPTYPLLTRSCLLAMACLIACGFAPRARGQAAKPQKARLSLIDGDVRVSRGGRDEHQGNDKRPDGRQWGMDAANWEKAEVNLTLKPGFSLAVITGHAEVAFEDGSTMYLGENSLMSFGKLNSNHNSVDLVSGTLSLSLHPVKNGWYRVTTPTDQMKVEYPDHAVMRMTAYLDGTAITAFETGTANIGGNAIHFTPGKVTLWRGGRNIDAAAVQAAASQFTGWDSWVAQRIASGGAALIPAGYTIPNASKLRPIMADLRIVPRTVAQATLSNSYMTTRSGVNPISFDLNFQQFLVFVEVTRRNKIHSVPEVLGGGPSATHRGKDGSLKRNPVAYIPPPESFYMGGLY